MLRRNNLASCEYIPREEGRRRGGRAKSGTGWRRQQGAPGPRKKGNGEGVGPRVAGVGGRDSGGGGGGEGGG